MADISKQDLLNIQFYKKMQTGVHWINQATHSTESMLKAGQITQQQFDQLSKTWSNFAITGEASVDRLNKALGNTGLTFEAVGASIGKATLKVAFWLVATTAVIGAIRKVQQVVQLWRDLEITLERIGITTSTVSDNLYRFFDVTADVAIRMGMPIEQTLTGMDLALRATAGIESQAKRTRTAQIMLRDAAVLGNVAGMQFSQAIDILVGSLRQTDMELDQGVMLLDKWVAVAKSAAVSVNDLSQGFAIMSSAAASAGLNVDEVNGIITALSEAVTLGPVEVGNAIRALMATLYNEGSINTMRRFGVAVRDATGEFRSFWDIMSELSSMQVSGALSEEQILQIAKAAGAGQRRYAQFVALLKNWGNAVRAANISANAHGEALAANERIVDTLTNAWDQFTAAQNKFWYAFGEKSGLIQDLTDAFKSMAGVFSTFANLSEPLSRIVKVVAELAIAFGSLKLAATVLTRVGIAAWASKAIGPLVGLGTATAAAAGAQVVNVGRFGTRLQAPAGGMMWAGAYRAPGTFISGQAVGGAAMAGATWRNAGRQIGEGLFKPMRGVSATFGVVAGGMMMRELYQSNWSGIGGAIGGGIGGLLGGPVGMMIGSVIGGGIAKLIEQAGMTFEEKVAAERKKWLEDLPASVAAALSRLHEEISFSISDAVVPPLGELINDQADLYAEQIAIAEAELARLENLSLSIGQPQQRWLLDQPAISPTGFEARIENLTVLIAELEELQRRITEESSEMTTKYDQAAVLAAKIREEDYEAAYGITMQEAAEARVEEIKKRALELTSQEREELISLALSAPIAYSNILARLKTYAPDIAKQFEAAYPTYEDFVALKPEAYGPLQEALATILQTDQNIVEATEDIANAARWLTSELGGTETNLENITKQYDYWKAVQDAYLEGLLTIKPMYDLLGLDEATASEEDVLNRINDIVDALLRGKEAQEDMVSLTNEQAAALALLSERYEYLGKYIEPGRLAFFDVDADLGRIQGIINRYADMFRGFIVSTAETYHAFIKDEQGVIQGLYGTFEAQPEVWQAMLGELQGIEENTSKMLEAEYNIPSWYATPTRYWAMKTTGTHEFGPAQTGLWELWMEFLARQNDELGDLTVAATNDTTAMNQLTGAINDQAEAAFDAADLLSNVETHWEWLPPEVGLLAPPGVEPKIQVPSQSDLLDLWYYLVQNKGMQGGGTVPETGPYYMHKGEIVSSTESLADTNSILNNSYRVLAISQQYLSSINLGIIGVRQEIQQLRADMQQGVSASTATEFGRNVKSGYVGVSALGIRRM